MEFSKEQKLRITRWYIYMADYECSTKLIVKMEKEAIKEYLNMCEKRSLDPKKIDYNIKKINKRLRRI